ncbi:MAG: hypothetical protein LUF91_04175, partial [Oscillospiraceae bacterium]|nr:hypothetical protein [Oscillospiraceae bacterium]
DGTFGPDDTLTGYAWEKMLLAAVGYNAEYEGMTGTTWTIGVAKLAKATQLEEDVATTNTGSDVSRDLAAKLAYNAAVNLVIVLFKDDTIGVTSGDVSVSINSGSYDEDYNVDNNNILITYWKATIDSSDVDDFGRLSTTYFIDELNFELTVAEDPVAVVSARTNSATMASLLSGYKLYISEYKDTDKDGVPDAYAAASLASINNSTKYNATSKLYSGGYVTQYDSNGDAYTAFSAGTQIANIGSSNSTDTIASALQDLTANGRVVEFYANDRSNSQVITDVVTIKYTVGKVTKASTSGTVTTYSVRSIDENKSATNYIVDSSDSSADTAFVASDVVKDDIVTYVVSPNNDHLYIYPTTSVEGYLSAFSTTNNANSVTVDGTRYSMAMGVSGGSNGLLGTAASTSAAFNASAAVAQYDFLRAVNKNVTLYLDQYGYAVYTDGTGSSDFVFVLDTASGGNVLDASAYDVGIIDQEGTTSIVYAKNSTTAPAANQWYTMSADGSYKTFSDAAATGNYAEVDGVLNGSKLSNSQATIITASATGNSSGRAAIANSSTVFIVKSNGSYKVYNGISNLATYSNLTGTAYAVVELEYNEETKVYDTGYAVAVYVDAGSESATSSNDEVIYLLKSGADAYASRAYDANGTECFTYDAIVDGVKTTISTSTTLPAPSTDATTGETTGYAPGLYTYSTDSDGYITTLNAVSIYSSTNQTAEYNCDLAIAADAVISYSSLVLQVNGESYTLSDDAVVYYIHGNSNTVDVGDASLLVGTVSKTATLYVVYTSASNHTITEVYFKTTGVINEN